jgi:hypothetical protein
MDEINEAFKKNFMAWTIFTFYLIGWIFPLLMEIFFAPTKNESHLKNHHSPFVGFLTLSIFYLLTTLTLGFIGNKNKIHLKLSGYIGISLIIFAAIYNES